MWGTQIGGNSDVGHPPHAGNHGEYMIYDERTSELLQDEEQNPQGGETRRRLPGQLCPPQPRGNAQLRTKQDQNIALDNMRFHTCCVIVHPMP
jgi:hypothetical protein